MPSLSYYRRIFAAYAGGRSQLSFWHEEPEVNEDAFKPGSNAFYMTFRGKAGYAGPFDGDGVPMLDYRGRIGLQYNPIAVAQYGLAAGERECRGDRVSEYRSIGEGSNEQVSPTPICRHHNLPLPYSSRACSDWLVKNLEPNEHGVKVWMHKFDWEYFKPLRAPWYSGLAQGQGIALLLRAWKGTGEERYLQAAEQAFEALVTPVSKGGTLFVDGAGDWWIEEYITEPPTHILNGFIWALWGVHDLATFAGSGKARELWERGVATLEKNLGKFDAGYWSLYDLAPVAMKNPASRFYHKLHIVQLDAMQRLTGSTVFAETAERWKGYESSGVGRLRARCSKSIFKLMYY